MSNAEHLANVMVEAFIAAVERGVDLVPVVADSTSTAKIAPFIKQFPGRLVNVGIAEQSMVGTAAGLALGGKVAVTCNAAPFLISRANEQIKVDVCYNNTNVKLFGLNAGASYGPLASTHHAIDDLAVMRGFGNIQIFAPSTPRECRQIIDYALAYQGPVYIRLDGKALPELLDESYRFVPGAVLTLREGEDVALVATGSTVHEVVEAAQRLADLGIQAKVVSVPSIRPCDTAALLAALVIIPAMAAGGADLSDGGPGLMFIFLVNVFNGMPGGRVIGLVFFLCVLFAGLTSLVNLYEVSVEALQDKLHLKRVAAVAVIAVIGTAVSLCIQAIVSDWMDVVSIYICPLGALLAGILFFWVAGKDFVLAAVNKGAGKPIGAWFYPLSKYVYCACALLALIAGALLGGIG